MAAGTTGIPPAPHVLLAPIGADGIGEVWKARDTRLNYMVDVKQGQHSARFEQEAGAIAALNHPQICRIHNTLGPAYRAGTALFFQCPFVLRNQPAIAKLMEPILRR
jgi:hypothetical protein